MNEKEEYSFDEAERGSVVQPPLETTQITIRIDTEILNWFRRQVHEAGGGNYQTLINEALRAYIQSQGDTFENPLKSVSQKQFQPVMS